MSRPSERPTVTPFSCCTATTEASARTSTAGERLADYLPTETELAEIGREMEARDERVDESPLTTDSQIVSTLGHECLRRLGERLEAHEDRTVREAFEVASWDCFFIHVNVQRALTSRDDSQSGWLRDDDPVQNDWNGSAKVALISLDRSVAAWNRIAAATADGAAAMTAERLQALRIDVERAFPNARKFVRPGFDE